MSHGPSPLPGIDDDRDFAKLVAVHNPEEIITHVEGRLIGHKVGGEYGDVIVYRPYGVQASFWGPITTDPDVEVPQERLIDARKVEHRALVWVEYNASSDLYDVPSLGLTSVRNFSIPAVGRWLDWKGMYVHESEGVTLVLRDRNGTTHHPLGKHSGFVTKGDYNLLDDQFIEGQYPDGQFQLYISPLVKPEWITGKVVEIIDAETLQPIHDAALAAFIVGEFVTAVLVVRRNRETVAALWQRRTT